MASVGSLAYAEDDGRHILGVKVAHSPASVRGAVADIDGIACHVLECENEVRPWLHIYIHIHACE